MIWKVTCTPAFTAVPFTIAKTCCSVTQQRLTLQPHRLQHASLPYALLTPRACSNSRPLSQWRHPTISSFVVPFSSCLQPFLASGASKRVSSSHQVAKVLEFQLQRQSFQWILRTDSFRTDWFDLLAVHGTLESLLQHHILKWCFGIQPFLLSSSHIHTWLLEKS